MSETTSEGSFIPGSDTDCEEIFQYPYTTDENTLEYLKQHGRIMFIIRGVAGTGKESLAQMLSSEERYPGAVVCSADDYFKNTFSTKKRDRESLKQSHEYCRKRVEAACKKGNHPIVIKNTHVKKFEVQNYLNLAAEFDYTIIIASTMGKFQVTPEILAKSNTKGLDADYFKSRLKQWQDIFPVLTGWFLSPVDSSYVLNIVQTALDCLLGDGKFCRVLNCFEKDKLFEYYKGKRSLYCVAACSKKNKCFDLKKHYQSEMVREHYGQCFNLAILGLLVTTSNILAIVYLDEVMQKLHQSDDFTITASEEDSLENILDMESLHISPNVKNNFTYYNENRPLKVNFDSSGKSASFEAWGLDESIDAKRCSCIHLAETKAVEGSFPWTIKMKFHALLASVADSNGLISIDKFGELEDGYRFCRLPANAWILRHPEKISFKSVFTGMYI